jgi:hypothetical protein
VKDARIRQVHVVITVIHPRDPLHLAHHPLDLALAHILGLPVVQVLGAPLAVDMVVSFEGVVPDAEMPLEGEGWRVDDDEEEQNRLDCIVSMVVGTRHLCEAKHDMQGRTGLGDEWQ